MFLNFQKEVNSFFNLLPIGYIVIGAFFDRY